jgi:RimJ/RimL family protein N-acetyltransferase
VFIGFVGLSVPRRALPFSPCVEIGWRLARPSWGQGYATEGARAALRVGCERLEHPGVPENHRLRPHCLYRITRAQWSELPPFTP